MPLETGSFISALVASNPPATDDLAEADDHMRFIKAKILETFPNINDEVTATPETLNDLEDGEVAFGSGTSTAPTIRMAAEATLGFFRPSAGKLQLSDGKRLLGNGTVAVGSLHHFPKVPASLGVAGGGGGPFEYLECDGTTTWLIADYPDLAAFLGTTFGGNGTTTFGVPNEKDTGRFRRSRTGAVAVGTYQANVIKTHTHAVSGTAASDGAHIHSITDPGHTHSSFDGAQATVTGGGGNIHEAPGNVGTSTTGITIDSGGAHTHTVTGTAAAEAAADTETRPEAFVCISCIKT